MGYSESPITLDRIAPQFNVLISSHASSWACPPNGGRRWAGQWAYKLREGLHLAQLFPERYPELTRIAASTRIITRPNQVLAIVLEAQGELEMAPSHVSAPEAALATVSEQHHTLASITAFYRSISSAGIYRVQNHSLSPDELNQFALILFADGWMLLKDRSGSLTFAPDDPAVPAEAKVTPAS